MQKAGFLTTRLIKYMLTICNAKDSHIFPTKQNGVFVCIYNFNETLTNYVVDFKQTDPSMIKIVLGVNCRDDCQYFTIKNIYFGY